MPTQMPTYTGGTNKKPPPKKKNLDQRKAAARKLQSGYRTFKQRGTYTRQGDGSYTRKPFTQQQRTQGRLKALGDDAPKRKKGQSIQEYARTVLEARRAQKAEKIGKRAYARRYPNASKK